VATASRPRASVTIHPEAIRRVSTGPAGAALLRRRAERVAELARQLSATNGTIPLGIEVGPIVGKSIKVTSTNPHTLLVHNGSRAHLIRPRNRRYLRFELGGRVFYTKLVRHPGYKGNPFMTEALRAARL